MVSFSFLRVACRCKTLANLFGGSQQTCKALSKLAHRVTPFGDPLGFQRAAKTSGYVVVVVVIITNNTAIPNWAVLQWSGLEWIGVNRVGWSGF